MEKSKISRVRSETMGNQKVEIYLNDLNNRFKELRKQHEAVLENSVNIIQEISEVSSELSFFKPNTNPRIKDLIRGFESASVKEIVKNEPFNNIGKHSLPNKLDNMDNSNGPDILKESLVVFKRAKDTLNKIDTLLNQITEESKSNSTQNLRSKSSPLCPARNVEVPVPVPVPVPNRNTFASCFNSTCSLNNFKSIEDCRKTQHENGHVSPSFCDMGYQGDIDESEYDLHATKKNKEKWDV